MSSTLGLVIGFENIVHHLGMRVQRIKSMAMPVSVGGVKRLEGGLGEISV